MLEIIRIGKISTYPFDNKKFRQLLLKDTISGLEAVSSLKEMKTRNNRSWWEYLISYLENPVGELDKFEGKIVEHTETALGKRISLNIVLLKSTANIIAENKEDSLYLAWKDQYKKMQIDVLNKTTWVWTKE